MSNETVVYHPKLNAARAVPTSRVEEWAGMGWLTDRPEHITDESVPRVAPTEEEPPVVENEPVVVTATDDTPVTGDDEDATA